MRREATAEPITVWQADGFQLRTYDAGTDDDGREVLRYVLHDLRWRDEAGQFGRKLFKGGDFKPSPLLAIDSDEAIGALLGFLSLYLVQSVVRSLAGARVAWVTAVAVLGLASFGVYLGRVLRWNSWDVLAHPRLLSDLDVILVDPRAIGMTVLLSSFLTLSYLVLYAFMRLEGAEER